MVDLNSLWNSLEEDGRGRNSGLVLRKLRSIGLHIGIDPSRERRILILEIESSRKIAVKDLPTWQGVELQLMPFTDRKKALALRLIDNKSKDIFNALIRDLDQSLTEAITLEEALALFINRLERWRLFFERYGLSILGPEAQRGLFGELYFLKEHILPHTECTRALHFWRGHSRKHHDFSFVNGNVEVKTTIKKEHKTVVINSEKQLDNAGLGSLCLYCLAMNASENKGCTLPQMVRKIREAIGNAPGGNSLFTQHLSHAGYIDEHEDHYAGIGYLAKKEYFFRVEKGFPRIIDPPKGVGDVRYSIVLSACSAFQVEIDSEVRKMIGGNGQ